MKKTSLILLSSICLFACTTSPGKIDYTTWEEYLGGPDRNHYSTLTQITPGNVANLSIAWSYSAPDSGQMQMNPVIVDGILYGVTAAVQAFALDAETGEELWLFGDPQKVWHSTSRGVSYWENGEDKRILYTAGPNLYALNALSGEPILSFGDSGKVNLNTGLPNHLKDKFVISNTPGTIFEDLIIMPMRLHEGEHAPPGDIRAFNVVTGELAWTFHTIPHPGELGYETWENPDAYKNINVGAANNWAGMSVDRDAGILFVPTGSASPDFMGTNRLGSNLFANTLLALDARTGERIWHYQLTHHDLLDRDLPAPPNLIQVEREGKKINAVAQITKQGYVYVFSRYTGEPLFDIEEVPVPASALRTEEAWPTQPIPVKPEPFARISNNLKEDDISPYAPNREQLLELFRRSDRREYAPPSTSPVLLFPGYDGGAEWGGAAAEPDKGIIYVNANEMAWILQMEETGLSPSPKTVGENLYLGYCASCHRSDRTGNEESGYPSLVEVINRLIPTEIAAVIETGKGMMAGFPQLSSKEVSAIIDYLAGSENQELLSTTADPDQLPYRHTGYQKFLDSNGLPAIAPPWGTLSSIDLNTGEYRWQVPLGETESLKQAGFPQTGTENYGGPLVTESGLLFIAATKDGFLRAYHKDTGALLWEYKLPAAAFATPSTYQVNSKQYIVIACGGEKLGTAFGNQVVAFSLN